MYLHVFVVCNSCTMEETFRKYELISKKFVDERFLLRTPYPIAGITLLYLFMVFIFIPIYMRDKKPFVLKNVVLVYNVLQIVLNFYVVYSSIPEMFAHNVQFSCPIPNEKLLYTVYWYLLLKIVDLIETGFFALKKKNNQITFLHVYHHCMILSLSYYASVNLKAAGQAIYYTNVNSCVHFVMYMYYFLSAYNPNSKYIRLKKFVTQVQLVHDSASCYYFDTIIKFAIMKIVTSGDAKRKYIFYVVRNADYMQEHVQQTSQEAICLKQEETILGLKCPSF
ncbi:hypothetical protein HA402_003864 [Bradysia odoriphaga]|nr:hypothetical protein HA402_003864 [Bradysia odoriphaga]